MQLLVCDNSRLFSLLLPEFLIKKPHRRTNDSLLDNTIIGLLQRKKKTLYTRTLNNSYDMSFCDAHLVL